MGIGYLDYKKGTYSAEQQLTKELSPVWRDVFTKFALLEKQNQQLLNALQAKRDEK